MKSFSLLMVIWVFLSPGASSPAVIEVKTSSFLETKQADPEFLAKMKGIIKKMISDIHNEKKLEADKKVFDKLDADNTKQHQAKGSWLLRVMADFHPCGSENCTLEEVKDSKPVQVEANANANCGDKCNKCAVFIVGSQGGQYYCAEDIFPNKNGKFPKIPGLSYSAKCINYTPLNP